MLRQWLRDPDDVPVGVGQQEVAMSPGSLLDRLQDASTHSFRVREDLLELLSHPELGLRGRPDAMLRLRCPNQMNGNAVSVENGIVRSVEAVVYQRGSEAAHLLKPFDGDGNVTHRIKGIRSGPSHRSLRAPSNARLPCSS